MSFSESVSLSENFTYETGFAVTAPALETGRIGVGIRYSLWVGFFQIYFNLDGNTTELH